LLLVGVTEAMPVGFSMINALAISGIDISLSIIPYAKRLPIHLDSIKTLVTPKNHK